MEFKNAVQAISMAIIAITLFAGASAAASTSPTGLPIIMGNALYVSSETYYEPSPIAPGSNFEFWVRVENKASSEAGMLRNVQCRIDAKFPFSSADPSDALVKDIGTLARNQQVQLDFRLRADDNAVDGDNRLFLSCRSDGGEWTQVELKLKVQSDNAALLVSQATTNPAEITPGGVGTLQLTLRNTASSTLRNVRIALGLSDLSIPVSPSGTSSDAYVEKIAAKAAGKVEMELFVGPTAQTGIYSLPIMLNYEDQLGNHYSHNTTVSLVIYSKPEILISVDRTDVLRSGTKATVVVSVTNKGISNVKRLTTLVGTSPQFELLSRDAGYIGDIDSNDFESFEVQMFINTTGKELTIPVSYEFLDALNRRNSGTENLKVRVYSMEEIASLQLEQATGGMNLIIIAIVLLVAAYLLYTRVLRKKKA